MPYGLKLLAALAALVLPGFAPASAAWKHEVVPNNGDELTYRENGKLIFYLGCGRGFALHVKYPGQARKEGEADIAISTSRGRMTFNGEFEDPDVFDGTDFRQTYLGYLHSDPQVFGKKWNATKKRVCSTCWTRTGRSRCRRAKAAISFPPSMPATGITGSRPARTSRRVPESISDRP